nr:MAG TPA: hypothetical protein [Microviridae sp.]
MILEIMLNELLHTVVLSLLTGRDVVSPFTINSLNDIGDYAERVASYGCLVIIDSIKEENDFCELSRQFELSKPAIHE